MGEAGKLKFHLPAGSIWRACPVVGATLYEAKDGDVIECQVDSDGQPLDPHLREAVEAGIASFES